MFVYVSLGNGSQSGYLFLQVYISVLYSKYTGGEINRRLD